MSTWEIVYSGLCSFLNPGNTNNTMPPPSVILVRTDLEPMADMDGTSDEHVSFLGFDSRKTRVSDLTGFERFASAPDFFFLRLKGMELTVSGDLPGVPRVDDTFKNGILKKDSYWPEAANQWDRRHVPEGQGKPKKSVVNAFIRLGGGTLSAARTSLIQWSFPKADGSRYNGYFSEEATYTNFRDGREILTITLTDLSSSTGRRVLEFSAIDPTSEASSVIFIGNNTDEGMLEAFMRARRPGAQPKEGKHVKFLNRVADPELGDGPVPVPYPPPVPVKEPPAGTNTNMTMDQREAAFPPGGGGSAGFCGPGSANG